MCMFIILPFSISDSRHTQLCGLNFWCVQQRMCERGKDKEENFFYILLVSVYAKKVSHSSQTARFLSTVPCLVHIVLKFDLRQSTLSSPNFAPKWYTPVDLSVGDIRRQIAAMVRDRAMVTVESQYETAIADFLWLSLTPKNGGYYTYEQCRLSPNYTSAIANSLRCLFS